MTLTTSPEGYDLTEYKQFNSNSNRGNHRPVMWSKTNLNTATTRHILSFIAEMETDPIFVKSLLTRVFSIPLDFRFLFQLTHIGRLFLDFVQFCKVVSIFSRMNEAYRRRFHAARMFKNMICHTRLGKNYPISCPEELVYKLQVFNSLAYQGTITYFDILDCASEDISKGKIKTKEYVNIIYLIIKASYKAFGLRSFEREICKRALVVFKKLGNKKYIAGFQKLMYKLNRYS